MLEHTIELGQSFISGVWSLFSVTVPGMDFTFAQLWIGIAICSMSIFAARQIFSFSGGSSSRSGSTDHAKISKERQNDEF